MSRFLNEDFNKAEVCGCDVRFTTGFCYVIYVLVFLF